MCSYVERGKALDIVKERLSTDLTTSAVRDKEALKIHKNLSPGIAVLVAVVPIDEGFHISTYFGFRVPEEKIGEMIVFLNGVNNRNIRGQFYIDGDRDIMFKNFVPCRDEVDIDVLIGEIPVGLKEFLALLGEICNVIDGDGKGKDEDAYIIKE